MTNARPQKETGAVMDMPGGQSHGTADLGQDLAAQLRRRRQAALRCEPLQDGRRDPWSCRGQQSDRDLDAWVRALAHLEEVGLIGLAPAHVRQALASRRPAA